MFLCYVGGGWCDDSVWRYLLDVQLNGWNKNVLTFQRGLREVRRIRLNIGPSGPQLPQIRIRIWSNISLIWHLTQKYLVIISISGINNIGMRVINKTYRQMKLWICLCMSDIILMCVFYFSFRLHLHHFVNLSIVS